ncbi:MAG TPA: hypothetical protein VLJ10_04930, partial [Candidatus Bathyarchaeia archaeon]|nr:hypothetical protein [Candidatus Bathyarchaeia archaeon]
MRTLDFKNNALFLACYHERNRPVLIFCLVGLISAVFILAYLSFTVEKAPMKDLLEGMFWVVLIMQSVLVTVVGSLFVWHMGAHEKSSGTL